MPAESKIVGLDKFVKHVDTFGRKAATVNRDIVGDIALKSKQILLAEARSDAPHGLHRFAQGKGAKLKVSYDVKAFRKDAPTALVVPAPPGPWYLLEKGSPRAYVIVKKGAVKRAGRNRVVAAKRRAAAVSGETGRGFLGSPGRFAATSPVWHPAQRSRHTWSNGARKAVQSGRGHFAKVARRRYFEMFRG